jgi:hypothetical protein
MATVAFNQWVDAVFDHPLSRPERYWRKDFDGHWDTLGLFDSVVVENLTHLFLGPDRLDRYSLEQVTPGIWFLFGELSPSQSTQPLLKSNVPLLQRIGCVDAMRNFFRVFVAPAPGGAMSRRILFRSPATCGENRQGVQVRGNLFPKGRQSGTGG